LNVSEQSQEARRIARSVRFGAEAPNYNPGHDTILQAASLDEDPDLRTPGSGDEGYSSEESAVARARKRPPPVNARKTPVNAAEPAGQPCAAAAAPPVRRGVSTRGLQKMREACADSATTVADASSKKQLISVKTLSPSRSRSRSARRQDTGRRGSSEASLAAPQRRNGAAAQPSEGTGGSTAMSAAPAHASDPAIRNLKGATATTNATPHDDSSYRNRSSGEQSGSRRSAEESSSKEAAAGTTEGSGDNRHAILQQKLQLLKEKVAARKSAAAAVRNGAEAKTSHKGDSTPRSVQLEPRLSARASLTPATEVPFSKAASRAHRLAAAPPGSFGPLPSNAHAPPRVAAAWHAPGYQWSS